MKLKRICLFIAAAMMLSACGSAMAAWNQYEPGNLLYFGPSEQDGNLDNGPDEIE